MWYSQSKIWRIAILKKGVTIQSATEHAVSWIVPYLQACKTSKQSRVKWSHCCGCLLLLLLLLLVCANTNGRPRWVFSLFA